MTGKRPPRYLLQRDYGAGFVTIREYVQRKLRLLSYGDCRRLLVPTHYAYLTSA